MLREHAARHSVFQIQKETIDGIAEARLKGAESFPELYYSYMEQLSRQAVQLFAKGVTDRDLWTTIAPTWSHNLFNFPLGNDPLATS
jgi:hypothetical protein